MEKKSLSYGLYDALLDRELYEILKSEPGFRTIMSRIEIEEQPARYASFIARIVESVLRQIDPENRIDLCNDIINLFAQDAAFFYLENNNLVSLEKPVLSEITPPHYSKPGIPRPVTSIVESSLFTGSPREPQLYSELTNEIVSADSVDVLVSFIKWSGLRLLIPAFRDLNERNVPVRIITTSYMGASDASAIEFLSEMSNIKIKVSYDTERTRLHAKAYYFKRNSGFSTAYIGSANMSNAAMTSGLEWNLKITAQDLPHIVEKFCAEFETYWNNQEFVAYDASNPGLLRDAINRARHFADVSPMTFFDIRPYPFQESILDSLTVERKVHNSWRNLVIAATGTGKTVIAALDFKRFYEEHGRRGRLLFVAHRQEILQQALQTFRNVLRISDFGQLQVGPYEASRNDHLFISVDMVNSRELWNDVPSDFYDFIIIDEVHHGPSSSYRAIFDFFRPNILLGLTATPERMDEQSVVADFNNRFAAEIRLPDALEEKLLCPFHYFGVSDPVALDEDRFWTNGKYDVTQLENIYTGAHVLAMQRVEKIISSLEYYQRDLSLVKGIGFCVSVRHAEYMAEMFNKRNICSGVITGETPNEQRIQLLNRFRAGHVTFLFTRDVFNEGLDIPDINTVLFLRPTESLTVFLQQLGRGLRHADEKECLTVLDFVGQAHRRYRTDTKFRALLRKQRFGIDTEVKLDFPHLPSGCSIQLDRISKEYVLKNIRDNFQNLSIQIPERIQTFEHTAELSLTFSNFVRYHDYEPEVLLKKYTWTGWKARAGLCNAPTDADLSALRPALLRSLSITGPNENVLLRQTLETISNRSTSEALAYAGNAAIDIHYRIWGKNGNRLGIPTIEASFDRLSKNPSVLKDLIEVLEWVESEHVVLGEIPELPFSCKMELHAQYGIQDIQANLGKATMETAGQTGVGVIHLPEIKSYVLLITFQKTEREFSPSTMYADYPINRDLLHWESQSNTPQNSNTGQNLIDHKAKDYTILIFARDQKKRNGLTVPFVYLGPADLISYESERPIRMIWRLRHSMPAEMFEENRRGG